MQELDDLKRLIEPLRPARLLLIGDFEREALLTQASQCGSDVTSMAPSQRTTLGAGDRFDLAIVMEFELRLELGPTQALLAALRDVHARRLLVLASEASAVDFKTLGFERLARYPATQRQLYGFELKNYKSTPDWLNAQYWANPQMWDKKRW